MADVRRNSHRLFAGSAHNHCCSLMCQTAEDWAHCCDWLLLTDMASGVEGTSTDVRAKISRSSSSHFWRSCRDNQADNQLQTHFERHFLVDQSHNLNCILTCSQRKCNSRLLCSSDSFKTRGKKADPQYQHFGTSVFRARLSASHCVMVKISSARPLTNLSPTRLKSSCGQTEARFCSPLPNSFSH